jgi:hypothetical protein
MYEEIYPCQILVAILSLPSDEGSSCGNSFILHMIFLFLLILP